MIQGFRTDHDGVSRIVFIDLVPLGKYRNLSFGDGVSVSPFNEIQVETLNAQDIERKFRRILGRADNI